MHKSLINIYFIRSPCFSQERLFGKFDFESVDLGFCLVSDFILVLFNDPAKFFLAVSRLFFKNLINLLKFVKGQVVFAEVHKTAGQVQFNLAVARRGFHPFFIPLHRCHIFSLLEIKIAKVIVWIAKIFINLYCLFKVFQSFLRVSQHVINVAQTIVSMFVLAVQAQTSLVPFASLFIQFQIEVAVANFVHRSDHEIGSQIFFIHFYGLVVASFLLKPVSHLQISIHSLLCTYNLFLFALCISFYGFAALDSFRHFMSLNSPQTFAVSQNFLLFNGFKNLISINWVATLLSLEPFKNFDIFVVIVFGIFGIFGLCVFEVWMHNIILQMENQREDVFHKFIPVYKSAAYAIGFTMVAPFLLRKVAALTHSDIIFNFDVYNIVKK